MCSFDETAAYSETVHSDRGRHSGLSGQPY
jgi:hypothetical protein